MKAWTVGCKLVVIACRAQIGDMASAWLLVGLAQALFDPYAGQAGRVVASRALFERCLTRPCAYGPGPKHWRSAPFTVSTAEEQASVSDAAMEKRGARPVWNRQTVNRSSWMRLKGPPPDWKRLTAVAPPSWTRLNIGEVKYTED